MFDKLKAYGWQAAALVLAVLLLGQTFRLHTAQLETAHVEAREAKAAQAYADERAKAALQFAAKSEANRKAETNLNKQAAATRQKTNEKIAALDARAGDLLERVRRAEARASGADVPGSSPAAGDRQAGPGGDGAELLGSLGTADVQEAKRADTIRLHLAACYADYDRAQAALEALNKGDQ
jgi:hypothetical protein